MNIRILVPILFILSLVLLTTYLIRKKPWEAFQHPNTQRWVKGLTWFMVLYVPIGSISLFAWGARGSALYNALLGAVFAFLITLFCLILYFLIADIIAFSRKSFRFALTGTPPSTVHEGRRKVVRQLGIGLAAAPFFSFLYGMTRGRYNFTVRKVALRFPDLPKAFDGLTIAQISDVHSGSFDNLAEVERGIQLIQAQQADLILFTGDYVNERAEEATALAPHFNALSAPLGKFAVLGNHDYGFSRSFSSTEEQASNHAKVRQQYASSGFQLLNNEHRWIERAGEKICLVGVENWGKPPFPQHGDLNLATQDVPDEAFKILMSHDPTHWDAHVLPFPKKIHLTLSGHTHGMQMGIDIPWLRFSFAKFIYPRWMDLYQEGERFLYVNRGFGWLGMPARVGIFPEITIFELKSA